GGGHHRHGLPTIIGNGQTTVVNVPPVPTAAMATTSTTVLSVAHANILDTGAVTVAQNSQAIPPRGYLIVAPTAPDTTDDVPKKENQQGDGAMSDRSASSSGASRVVEGVGGTMSRQALDEFFADPTSREQTKVEEEPALAGSAAPVIDVMTGAE